MEIHYQRTYVPPKGKRYTLGKIQGALGYALETADAHVPLKGDRLKNGGICMMLFAITPEEYAWKDGDLGALDDLVQRLCKEIPADRLLGWRICDSKGTSRKADVQLRTGESIDGGVFAARMKDERKKIATGPIDKEIQESRRLQNLCANSDASEDVKQEWQAARAALGKAILNLNTIYTVDSMLLDGRWPAVGFDGKIEIFTTQERAECIKPQFTAAVGGVEIWKICARSGEDAVNYLRACAVNGLTALRIDNGFAAAEIDLKDFMSATADENARLRSFMIREIEAGVLWNQLKASGAEEKYLRNALEGMLTFRNFAWREIGNAALYVICADGAREKCVVLSGKDNGEKWLGVFTNRIHAAAFAEKMNGNPIPQAMRFDELTQRADMCKGILIDINALNYRLPATEFDRVKELRSKAPVVVRVKPPEVQTAVAKTESAQDVGGLPNPDDFPVSPTKKESVESPIASPVEEKAEKRRFFKKFFGKRDTE